MDVNLVISGAAGQGINTISNILLRVIKKSGLFVSSAEDIMSRIRGGTNASTIRISDDQSFGFKREIDILIPMTKESVDWVSRRLTDKTLILDDEKVQFNRIAKEVGSKLFLNSVIAGLVTGLLDLDFSYLKELVSKTFASKGEELVGKNLEAVSKGYEVGLKYRFPVDLKRSDTSSYVLLSGAEAIGLGAAAGGANFVSFYPMSPSTAVAVFLTQHMKELGIVVEQFEGEISAVNASIGAWFAGGRGLVTTSGGGFALMEEAISLAGMSENPLVIHLAQRPGPATGLPTRTMQGDLNLALYAGHGEFARVIYAPSTLKEAFYLMQKAMNIADKYQIPVFVLTDQFLIDGHYMIEEIHPGSVKNEKFIVKTEKDYRRYRLTDTGVSPRGIPGLGEGIVLANGNEHDEWGDTTEDEELSKVMPEKRLRKLNSLIREVIEPDFYGPESYETLVISWGSTFYTVREAVKRMDNTSLAHLHFSRVYPISRKTQHYLEKAKKVFVVEGNMTGQFADLLKKEFGATDIVKVLKYNGRQLYVEEIMEKLS